LDATHLAESESAHSLLFAMQFLIGIFFLAGVQLPDSSVRTGPSRDRRLPWLGLHVFGCAMTWSEVLLFFVGAIVFAAAVIVVLGVAMRLITLP
jgi:hypothetical protein